MIIKYYDLATTNEFKLKAEEERENKLEEEMTTLRKSYDSWIVEKEMVVSKECGQVVDALSRLDRNEVLMKPSTIRSKQPRVRLK